jgi:hypothetical protein
MTHNRRTEAPPFGRRATVEPAGDGEYPASMFCPKCGEELAEVLGTQGALRQAAEPGERLTCLRGEMVLSQRMEELLVEWCQSAPAHPESTSTGPGSGAVWFCPLDAHQMEIHHGYPQCPSCQRTLTARMITTLVEIQPHKDW